MSYELKPDQDKKQADDKEVVFSETVPVTTEETFTLGECNRKIAAHQAVVDEWEVRKTEIGKLL